MRDTVEVPVEELEGRDLDAAVAREVMGEVPPNSAPHGCPRYSSQIATVWELVGQATDMEPPGDERSFELSAPHETDDGFQWWAKIRGEDGNVTATATAPTAPEAICRAALKAVRSQ